MPNRKKRARRRQGGAAAILPTLIVLCAIVAAALVVVLVNSNPLASGQREELPYDVTGKLVFSEDEGTPAPLVLGAMETPAPTAEGATVDTPAPTAEGATVDTPAPTLEAGGEGEGESGEANRFIPAPMTGDYFLPIFDRALRTPDDPLQIAVLLDGCDDADKMTWVLNVAARYGARLTLFPTGDALMKLGSGFRVCVNTLHYELENCFYDTDKKDYAVSNGELALQIWRQSIAASYAMGADYQQHFYRSTMPESTIDQRTHFFIRKLGFLGVASYTYSYKGRDVEDLAATLENGNIYQFDMTDDSLLLFESFLNEANRKGYKVVTMNELFGLERNTVGDELTIDRQTLPDINDYTATYYDLKLNCRTNAVYALQARLMALGYLAASPGQNIVSDGIYGGATSTAVSKFQARVGIVATGNATAETQQKLFSPDAPFAQ